MPEGHTVHRLARAFADHFVGNQVDASSPQGRFAEGAAVLDGRVLEAAEAHGKHMFLRFSGDVWLRVHLGLYGMWRFAGDGVSHMGRRTRAAPADDGAFPPAPRGAVRLRLVAGRHVADLSGPTACEMLDPAQKLAAQQKLGEDPLRPDADPARAWAKLHRSKQPIGLMLMRQDVIAGVGNIYRAEVLFRARLDPRRPSNALTRRAWNALWKDLTALLQDGVRTGRIVTTEKRHRDAQKGAAHRADASYVANRAGRPCRICGRPVVAEPMGGRTLYWCPNCQTG